MALVNICFKYLRLLILEGILYLRIRRDKNSSYCLKIELYRPYSSENSLRGNKFQFELTYFSNYPSMIEIESTVIKNHSFQKISSLE